MIVHLLSASVMPQPGFYELVELSIDDFIDAVREAAQAGTLQHYIGYDVTLSLIEHLCKVSLGETNDAETILKDGDVLLIAKLKRRKQSISEKQRRGRQQDIDISDFVFFSVTYASA